MPSKPKFICKDCGLPGESAGPCPRYSDKMLESGVYNHPLRGALNPPKKHKRRHEVKHDR